MHTVAKAITDHVRDPELMVNSFRAMFGRQSVSFYVEQRTKMAEADQRDADLMRNLAYWTAQNRLPPTPGRSKGATTRFRMMLPDQPFGRTDE